MRAYVDKPLLGEKYGIIRSAKSACTAVLVWHLAAQGILSSAMALAPSPHVFWRGIAGSISFDPKHPGKKRVWIRVIRDPYLRAVSSYRHALRYNYISQLPKHLGRAVDENHGFSFLEYLEYLSTIYLAGPTCNKHHQIQYQPIERNLPVALRINADTVPNLYSALDNFACERGIPVPERHLIGAMGPFIESHAALRYAVAGDLSSFRFNQSQGNGAWPDYSAFLSDEAKELIRHLYRRDFHEYADLLEDDPTHRSTYHDRLPSDFIPDDYLRLNPDVAASGMDAAQHFVDHGKREGRQYRFRDFGPDNIR